MRLRVRGRQVRGGGRADEWLDETVVRMWRPRAEKARVRRRPGTGFPTGRFAPLPLSREPGADQAIHADALLSRYPIL